MEREAEYVLAQPATRLVAKVIDSVAPTTSAGPQPAEF